MAGRVVPMRVGDVELLVETSPVAGSEPTSKLSRAQDAVARRSSGHRRRSWRRRPRRWT